MGGAKSEVGFGFGCASMVDTGFRCVCGGSSYCDISAILVPLLLLLCAYASLSSEEVFAVLFRNAVIANSFPANGIPGNRCSRALRTPGLIPSSSFGWVPPPTTAPVQSVLVIIIINRGLISSSSASLAISPCLIVNSSSVAPGNPTSLRMGSRRRMLVRGGVCLGRVDLT